MLLLACVVKRVQELISNEGASKTCCAYAQEFPLEVFYGYKINLSINTFNRITRVPEMLVYRMIFYHDCQFFSRAAHPWDTQHAIVFSYLIFSLSNFMCLHTTLYLPPFSTYNSSNQHLIYILGQTFKANILFDGIKKCFNVKTFEVNY